MNKTEIQSRIEKCESEIASLKAEFAKCDCTDGIEQEKCWHALFKDGDSSYTPLTKQDCQRDWKNNSAVDRPAYMPECRQVTEQDVENAYGTMGSIVSCKQVADTLHKAGFRIKVTP